MADTITLEAAQAQAAAAAAEAAQELPGLRARRQALSLDAMTDDKARAHLEKTEREIARLVAQQERATLAVQEVTARQEAAAQLAAQAERDRLLAELADHKRARNERLAAIDRLLDELVPNVQAALEEHRAAYSIASQLAGDRDPSAYGVVWNIRERLARRIQTQLHAYLPALGYVTPMHRIEGGDQHGDDR
jgi:hypothetical protein